MSSNRAGTTLKPIGCGSVLKSDSSQDAPIFMFYLLCLSHIFFKCNFFKFSFYRRILGILHRVRTRTTRLTLVTSFQIIYKVSYPLLRVFTYMTDLIHSPVLFFLHHLSGIVLNTSLPLCVILLAVVEILCILYWFNLLFLSKPDTKTSV